MVVYQGYLINRVFNKIKKKYKYFIIWLRYCF